VQSIQVVRMAWMHPSEKTLTFKSALRRRSRRNQILVVGAFLFIVIGVGLPRSARAGEQNAGESQPQNVATLNPSAGVLTAITVNTTDVAVIIDISGTKSLSPLIQILERPDRLVFDFPGFELRRPNERLPINKGPVKGLRASEFSLAPQIARIVVDLRKPLNYETEQSGNTVTITINISPDRVLRSANSGIPAAQPSQVAFVAKLDQAGPGRSAARNAATVVSPRLSRERSNAAGQSASHAYGLLDKAKALSVSDLQFLEEKADAGDPEAATTLALAYHAGALLKIDDMRALQLLQGAAEKDYVAAEEALGIFYQLGIGTPPDAVEALAWYSKAATKGSRNAATNIALIYLDGSGVPKDSARALEWFRRAADAGDPTAQLNIAAMYHRGEGVPKDENKRLEWLKEAAEHNSVAAILELARLNMRSNTDAAVRWYTRAAELGDAFAQAALGEIFAEGLGVQPDYAKALQWYRKSADQGNREGQFGLGARNWLGQGVPADPQQAREWFALAAAQGHANAQYNLGAIYETGKGVPPDQDTATRYYQMAAEQGVANAQYRLGRLLKNRHASSADEVNAYKWLVLAEDRVQNSAAAASELRQSLAAAEIADAERQIDAWRAQHAMVSGQSSRPVY